MNKILRKHLIENIDTRLNRLIEDRLVKQEVSRYVTNVLTENRDKRLTDTDVQVLSENIRSYVPTLNKDILSMRKRVRNNPYCKNEMIVEGVKIALDDSTIKRLTKSDFDSLESLSEKLRTIIEEQ